MFLLNVLASFYFVVALLAMTHTIREYRESGHATLIGALCGCIVCLAWLPMFAFVFLLANLRVLNHSMIRSRHRTSLESAK